MGQGAVAARTTDDKGRFAMIGLRGGQWRFLAQAVGFEPQGGAMPIRMGSTNPPITFTLKKTAFVAYGPLGNVSNKDLQQDLAGSPRHIATSRTTPTRRPPTPRF
jgi:hypothetical protein